LGRKFEVVRSESRRPFNAVHARGCKLAHCWPRC